MKWRRITRTTLALVQLCLIITTSETPAFADSLAVIFTSVTNTGDVCEIEAEVDNQTPNHVNELSARIGSFGMDVTDLRAYARYTDRFYSRSTCTEVTRELQNSPTIERCSMDGVREGDCLGMVTFDSQLSVQQASQTDAEAQARKAEAQAKEAQEKLDEERAEQATDLACVRFQKCVAQHGMNLIVQQYCREQNPDCFQ